jgi:hypothetical protein
MTNPQASSGPLTKPKPSILQHSSTNQEGNMPEEETDEALKGDPDVKSGTGASGGLPDEGSTGDEGDGTGEGDAGPASGSS